jgi:hypothetical protein
MDGSNLDFIVLPIVIPVILIIFIVAPFVADRRPRSRRSTASPAGEEVRGRRWTAAPVCDAVREQVGGQAPEPERLAPAHVSGPAQRDPLAEAIPAESAGSGRSR